MIYKLIRFNINQQVADIFTQIKVTLLENIFTQLKVTLLEDSFTQVKRQSSNPNNYSSKCFLKVFGKIGT